MARIMENRIADLERQLEEAKSEKIHIGNGQWVRIDRIRTVAVNMDYKTVHVGYLNGEYTVTHVQYDDPRKAVRAAKEIIIEMANSGGEKEDR